MMKTKMRMTRMKSSSLLPLEVELDSFFCSRGRQVDCWHDSLVVLYQELCTVAQTCITIT